VTDAVLVKLLGSATSGGADLENTDRTSQRILDAALHEAATVGLQRLTVEEVVRRARVARMTLYRRYPRRDDLVEALVRRETRHFLAAVADGIDNAADPHDGVVEAFIAAVRFSRTHPMLRRAAHTESALSAADNAELLDMGAAFIARHIHGDAPGKPNQQARWVADVFARLFMTYIATPPTDPDFGDDTELRRFAHDVLTPMVERAVSARPDGLGS
jgi:AcrR family transcriptional regulator